MRQQLSGLLYDGSVHAWRLVRHVVRPAGERIILQPPSDFGSLGDQAMLDSASEFLTKQLQMEVIILARKGREIPVRSKVSYTFFSPGNLSLPTGTDLKAIRAGAMALLGADVIDGVYSNSSKKLRPLYRAYRAGLSCAALGFSFSETPAKASVERLRSMPDVRTHARDPISAKRFQAATGLAPIPVADLAFMLRPELRADSARSAMRWIEAARAAGRTILAVNSGGPGLWDEKSVTLPQLQTAVAAWLAADPKRCVILVPHDVRPGKAGDEEAVNALADHLSDFGADRVHLLRLPFDAWDAKALAGAVDFALTARMHFAIACLGMGVPPLCITYQGKFEGLMQHFALDDMFVRPGEPLVDQIEAFTLRVPQLRNAIVAQLPEIKRRSAANFDWLAKKSVA